LSVKTIAPGRHSNKLIDLSLLLLLLLIIIVVAVVVAVKAAVGVGGGGGGGSSLNIQCSVVGYSLLVSPQIKELS
jgi:hypothetical protein